MTNPLRFLAACLTLLCAIATFPGCGEADVGPKTELTDQDKKQIEELNQQRVDEWGNKVK